MLHDFSSHKDTWLSLIKVRVSTFHLMSTRRNKCPYIVCDLCINVVYYISSTFQNVSIFCVWICQDMREQHAWVWRTTPSRDRLGEYGRWATLILLTKQWDQSIEGIKNDMLMQIWLSVWHLTKYESASLNSLQANPSRGGTTRSVVLSLRDPRGP